jgi:hypothetical protein
MSSVVLNQKSGNDQVYATGVLAGSKGVVSKGGVSAQGTITATNQLGVVAGTTTAGPNATLYVLDNAGVTAGGLEANHLQVYGYYDPAVASATIVEHADIYLAPIGGTAAALATQAVWRTNQSVPFNYAAPFIGTTTGTGAPLIVACAGIPTGAQIRFNLIGGDPASFVAGIAAPSAVSVQGNVSFTYTGTTGAIYSYEVLFA